MHFLMNKFLFRLRKYGPQPPPMPATLLGRLRRSALPYSGAAFRFQGQKIPSARDRQRQRRRSLMLQLLDFRRSSVKLHGSRVRWMRRLKSDWTTIIPFSSFYLELLTDTRNWKRFGFDTAVSLNRVYKPPIL